VSVWERKDSKNVRKTKKMDIGYRTKKKRAKKQTKKHSEREVEVEELSMTGKERTN
jgi:hypothetical protein